MTRFAPAAVLGSLLVLACEGEPSPRRGGEGASAGSAGSAAGGSNSTSLDCESRATGSPAPLRLQIRGEYERTLRSVFGDEPVDAAGPSLSQLSSPKPAHGFRSMATGTTGGDVEARFQVSDVLAQEVAKAPAALAPCAGSQPLSPACVDELLTTLGSRLFRRPLDAGELAWLKGIYAEGEDIQPGDGLRFALFAALESPHFIYRLEVRGTPLATDPQVLTLSAYELATRLSFLIWGMAPDSALLQSAASGQLDDAPGLKAALERLLADPRARRQLARFYAEWLEIEQLPLINQSPAFLAGIDGAGLTEAMQHELSETLLSLTLDAPGTFTDLFTSDLSFVESASLATIYDTEVPQPGERSALDPGRRAGLLTRSALLLTSGESTSPIRRGAFVRRKLLCDPIPPPDPNSFPAGAIQPPSFDPDTTARQRWTQKTSEPQCAGCHARFNALGFALENYDALGRYREHEPITDPTSGLLLKELPIDATVELVLDTAPVRVSGAVELGQALARSPRAQACLASQWLRFGAGRQETDADACVLRDVAGAIAEGRPLLEALEQVVLSPEFRTRRLEAP